MSGQISFEEIIAALAARMQLPLPGEEAQLAMAPAHRGKFASYQELGITPKESAVLVLCYQASGAFKFVLTKRTPAANVHGGQISLPGGKKEQTDADTEATALRETHEEVGIEPAAVKLIGRLTQLYIPVSNFLVQPVLGYLPTKPVFAKSEIEVADIVEADITQLLDPARRLTMDFQAKNNFQFSAPYFDIQGHVVWGATAMMLSEFKSIIQPIVRP